MRSGDVDEFDRICTFAVRVPVAVGVNVTLKVQDAPTGTLFGQKPRMSKSEGFAPVKPIWEKISG